MKIRNKTTNEVVNIPKGMENQMKKHLSQGGDPMELLSNKGKKAKLSGKKMKTRQEGGQAQQQGGDQQAQMQQLVQMAAQALSQGADPQQVAQMLMQKGVPQEIVQQVMQAAMQDLQQQQGQQQAPQEEQMEMKHGGSLNSIKAPYIYSYSHGGYVPMAQYGDDIDPLDNTPIEEDLTFGVNDQGYNEQLMQQSKQLGEVAGVEPSKFNPALTYSLEQYNTSKGISSNPYLNSKEQKKYNEYKNKQNQPKLNSPIIPNMYSDNIYFARANEALREGIENLSGERSNKEFNGMSSTRDMSNQSNFNLNNPYTGSKYGGMMQDGGGVNQNWGGGGWSKAAGALDLIGKYPINMFKGGFQNFVNRKVTNETARWENQQNRQELETQAQITPPTQPENWGGMQPLEGVYTKVKYGGMMQNGGDMGQQSNGIPSKFTKGGRHYEGGTKVNMNLPYSNANDLVDNENPTLEVETGEYIVPGMQNGGQAKNDVILSDRKNIGWNGMSPSENYEELTKAQLGISANKFNKGITKDEKFRADNVKFLSNKISEETAGVMQKLAVPVTNSMQELAQQTYLKQEQVKYGKGMDNDLESIMQQNQQPMAQYGAQIPDDMNYYDTGNMFMANGGKLKKYEVGGVNYDALLNVETQLGILNKNGIPTSRGYNSETIHQLDTDMEERIKNTIGKETWDKLPNNLKTQVFSFAFNNGVEKKNWLTGLAQAIDPSIKDRLNLSEADAITKIKSNISKIDSNVYNNYINTVLPDQYNSIGASNNKQNENKKLWQFRPDNINQFLTNNPQQSTQNQQGTSSTQGNVNWREQGLTSLQKGLRNKYTPFEKSEIPNMYGSDEFIQNSLTDFQNKYKIKIPRNLTDKEALEYARTYQNKKHPELSKDYKLNFARGNQALYDEFQKQKGYRKNSDEVKESNKFYDWATADGNKIAKDYIDKGKAGHEFYDVAPLTFDTEEEYQAFIDEKNPKHDSDWQKVGKYWVDRSAYDPADINNPNADPNRKLPSITYYDVKKPFAPKKQPPSDVVNPIKGDFSSIKSRNTLQQMPSFNMYIPNEYAAKPITSYDVNPYFQQAHTISPYINDIQRAQYAANANRGTSGAELANSAYMFGQGLDQYGKRFYDASVYNAGAKTQADAQNAQAAYQSAIGNRGNQWQTESAQNQRDAAMQGQRELDKNPYLKMMADERHVGDMRLAAKDIYNQDYIDPWKYAEVSPNDSESVKKAKEDFLKAKYFQDKKKYEPNLVKFGGKVNKLNTKKFKSKK